MQRRTEASGRRRYAAYAGLLLLGALIKFASFESARLTEEVGTTRSGEREVEVQEAGAGPIYTAHDDVVEARCSFVRAPGGLFYFEPENPETTACVHPPGVVGDVGPLTVGGALPPLCQRTPDRTVWCVVRAGPGPAADPALVEDAYEAGYLPRR